MKTKNKTKLKFDNRFNHTYHSINGTTFGQHGGIFWLPVFFGPVSCTMLTFLLILWRFIFTLSSVWVHVPLG
ncbi:hypothetical protein [Desulfobacter postgatei]|jgi:hypothetical protein|uniref:hypothetical protein n=1 Tax=Desulfobacter postgatei TaxID=2293 RepID=UPI002A35AA6B|nr:hypothetical protein [Desulfobacter postgatei]MDX9963548.1 hypothetical protein [Desulfobacter postgatei]